MFKSELWRKYAHYYKNHLRVFTLFFAGLIAGLVTHLSAPLVSAAPPPSLQPSAYEFMKPSSHADVALSPSGRYVAFLNITTEKKCLNRYGEMVKQEKAKCKDKKKSYRSKHEIYMFDLEVSRVVQKIPLPENFYVSWLEWANDEHLLAAVYKPTTIGKNKRAYELAAHVFSLYRARAVIMLRCLQVKKRSTDKIET